MGKKSRPISEEREPSVEKAALEEKIYGLRGKEALQTIADRKKLVNFAITLVIV